MRKFIYLFILFLLTETVNVSAQTPSTLTEGTRLQVAKAAKVEDLYQVRLQLKKASGKSDKTIAQMEDLAEAFRILSGGFARFSHFKNSVESYTIHLQYTEKVLEARQTASLDSIQKAHLSIKNAEEAEIAELSSGLGKLQDRRDSLSDFKSSYYLWSGIAAVIILLIFIITYQKIGRNIEEKKVAMDSGLDELKKLHSASVRARMELSTPAFLRQYANATASVFDQLSTGLTTEGTALLTGDHKKAAEQIRAKLTTLK